MLTNQPVPDVCLPDGQGRPHRLADLRGRVVVLDFWSAECPWSERADGQLRALCGRFPGRVVHWPVASNLNETPALVEQARLARGLEFVLLDAQSRLAREWGASNTPHIFVIDAQGVLRYQGALDDVTFRQRQPTRSYIDEAIEAVLTGDPVATRETQPHGCTIVRKFSDT